MTSLELRELRYFVAIAEQGQIARAARSLGLAQPALSQAMAQLESQLGVKLLERHPRGVSLTSAGETLFAKARDAVGAVADAERAARSHMRADRSVLQLGFIGTPPTLTAPELFTAFAAREPDAEISYRELAFPHGSTAAWLADVDVALCWSPQPDPEVLTHTLREEPRVLLAARGHPLARRRRLALADVLEEMFPGLDPAMESRWRGFWQLDDPRGRPARVTDDRATNPQEIVAIIASGRAVTTVPAGPARVLAAVLKGVVARPLSGVSPAELALIWRKENRNALVAALAATARALDSAGAARLRA